MGDTSHNTVCIRTYSYSFICSITHTHTLIRMPVIKLTYFNLRARAEPARLILKQAGADFEKDEAKKAQLQKDFNDKTVPTLIKNIERRLVERGGEWLVGGRLGWADIMTYHFFVELPDQTAVKASCKISSLVKRVGDQPNIKAWVESRPDTIC